MKNSDPAVLPASAVSLLPTGRKGLGAARVCELVVSVLVGGTWCASAVSHLANPYYFLSTIFKYEVVGSTIGQYVAMVLPWLQICLATCLFARWLVASSLFLSSLLLLAFSCLQLSVLERGLSIGCGCFAAASDAPITLRSVILSFLAGGCVFAAFVIRLRSDQADSVPTSVGVAPA